MSTPSRSCTGGDFPDAVASAFNGAARHRKEARPLYVIVLVCAIPFVFIVGIDPANFSEGYIGSKMKTEGDFLPLLGQSAVRALLAFNVRGDESFRSNPSGLAQLDRSVAFCSWSAWLSGLPPRSGGAGFLSGWCPFWCYWSLRCWRSTSH